MKNLVENVDQSLQVNAQREAFFLNLFELLHEKINQYFPAMLRYPAFTQPAMQGHGRASAEYAGPSCLPEVGLSVPTITAIRPQSQEHLKVCSVRNRTLGASFLCHSTWGELQRHERQRLPG
jgi:hypothetical protein